MGAHTLSALITALVKLKHFSSRHVRRALTGKELPGGAGAGMPLDAASLVAIRIALAGADSGFSPAQVAEALSANGLGLAAGASPETLHQVAELLAKVRGCRGCVSQQWLYIHLHVMVKASLHFKGHLGLCLGGNLWVWCVWCLRRCTRYQVGPVPLLGWRLPLYLNA